MRQNKGWVSQEEILQRLRESYQEALQMDRMGVRGAMNIAEDIYDAAMYIQEMEQSQNKEREYFRGKK